MRVAVLGTGIMGTGMAHSLLRSGLDVIVWNRTRDRAAPLEPLRDARARVFGAIAARTVWVSERPGDGTRLKLVANSWVGTIVAATAQSIALAEGLGLDPRVFLDMMHGSAVDAPYLHVKGQAIIARQFAPSFAVNGAVKDTRLIAAAMREARTDATLMEAVGSQYPQASHAGD